MEKHIFEIREEMKMRGWSRITPEEFSELDYFTQEFIKDTVEDPDGYNSEEHDIIYGCDVMFWDLHTEQW